MILSYYDSFRGAYLCTHAMSLDTEYKYVCVNLSIYMRREKNAWHDKTVLSIRFLNFSNENDKLCNRLTKKICYYFDKNNKFAIFTHMLNLRTPFLIL